MSTNSSRRWRRGLTVAALSLGLTGATLAVAPAASAGVANSVKADVNVPANLTLEKKVGETWTAQTTQNGVETFTFTGLADAQYRVVATNACGTKTSSVADASDPADQALEVEDITLVCDFIPTTPTRLLDTRATATGITHIDPVSVSPEGELTRKPIEGQVTRVKVKDITTPDPDVPNDVEAVALNVTGVDSTSSDNFITVWDCATDSNPVDEGSEPDPPLASNLNLATNDIRPNAVVTRVNSDDTICIFNRRPAHLIVDITGYFPSQQGDDHIELKAAPERVLETRLSQGQKNYQGGKPVAGQVTRVLLGAGKSHILNVTAVDGNGGWITVWDCADANTQDTDVPGQPDPPSTSNLNAEVGVISANLVVSKPGTGADAGFVCFYTSQSSHIIADHIGSFPLTSNYTPTAPRRVLETRQGIASSPQVNYSGGATKPAAGTTIVLDLFKDPDGEGALTAPLTAPVKAVALNVTGTSPTANGFVSVYPCADANTPRPNASNLNLVTGQSRPNLVLTGLTNGKVCLYTQNGTHLIADLFGSFPG